MPNPNYEQEYKEWLCGYAAADVRAFETVHIYGQAVGDNYFVNSLEPLTATLETGPTVTFKAASFSLTLPEVTTTTQQSIEAVFPGLEGGIYQRIKGIPMENRNQPVYLIHRVYLSDDTSKPMINPPTKLQVRRVSASRDYVKLEVSAPQWPNRAAGRYYNIEDYPGLANV